MGLNTINGDDLLKAKIYEPRFGVWHADIESDSAEDIPKGTAVTIELEDGLVSFVGTVFRGGLEQGRWIGRVVGGAGGLRTPVAARHYLNVNLGAVLDDLATASGETISSSSDTAITQHQRARWWRSQGTVAEAITTVIETLNRSESDPGYIWRVGRDGEIFLGVDTFEDLSFQNEELGRKPSLGEVVIAPLIGAALVPGVTFNEERIDYVLTDLVSESLRQRYWTANP